MPRVKDNQFVTFNDGKLDICTVSDRKILCTKEQGIRFGRRTVGVSRFWNAKVASSTVDSVVAIPFRKGVSTMDICLINGEQFKINQVQDKFDQFPPCLLLSLERIQIAYKNTRNDG